MLDLILTIHMDVFRAYNFDGDEAFKAHLQRVELPAGSAAAAALQRVKVMLLCPLLPTADPVVCLTLTLLCENAGQVLR